MINSTESIERSYKMAIQKINIECINQRLECASYDYVSNKLIISCIIWDDDDDNNNVLEYKYDMLETSNICGKENEFLYEFNLDNTIRKYGGLNRKKCRFVVKKFFYDMHRIKPTSVNITGLVARSKDPDDSQFMITDLEFTYKYNSYVIKK